MALHASQPDEATRAAFTPYAMVGGEPGLRRIVERFYAIMDSDPAAAAVRAMHPADLAGVREGLFEFLSGWLGGPALYQHNPNRKCIMSVHTGFAIDAAARDQWLSCMRRAFEEAGLPAEARAYLDAPLARLADMFRNR